MSVHTCRHLHRSRYRRVVFRDPVTGEALLTRSTMVSNKRIRWSDGREYPVVDLDLSGGGLRDLGPGRAGRA